MYLNARWRWAMSVRYAVTNQQSLGTRTANDFLMAFSGRPVIIVVVLDSRADCNEVARLRKHLLAHSFITPCTAMAETIKYVAPSLRLLSKMAITAFSVILSIVLLLLYRALVSFTSSRFYQCVHWHTHNLQAPHHKYQVFVGRVCLAFTEPPDL